MDALTGTVVPCRPPPVPAGPIPAPGRGHQGRGDRSVGTACFVLLFMAGEEDPLFLQVKEARASVLEPYAGASVFPTTASASCTATGSCSRPATCSSLDQGRPGAHFFIRQLRDIKISVRVETFGAREMDLYASWCGRALALSTPGPDARSRSAGIWARTTPSTGR